MQRRKRKSDGHELWTQEGSTLATLREMKEWKEIEAYLKIQKEAWSSYIFIQVGLLQVYHFKLDPLQNLLQRLACFVVQLLT